MAEQVLKVGGMTCDGCRQRVERAVTGVPGVSEAVVSLEQETLRVTYDSTAVNVESIRQAVLDAGYDTPA